MHIVFSQGHLSNARALAGGLLEIGVGSEVLENRLRTLDIALTMTGGSEELAEILELAEKAPSLEKRQVFLQLAARWMVLHENDLGKLLDHLRARSTPPTSLFQNSPEVIAGVTRAIQAHLHVGGAPSSARPKRTKILMAAGDKDGGTAVVSLGKIIPSLDKPHIFAMALALYPRIFDSDKDTYERAQGELSKNFHLLEPSERLEIVSLIEAGLGNPDPQKRSQGAYTLGLLIPHLADPEDRWSHALILKNWLSDKDWSVRCHVFAALTDITPHLEPAERRLEVTEMLVRQLGRGQWNNVTEYTLRRIERILPHLDEAGKWRVLFEADTVLRTTGAKKSGTDLDVANILINRILTQLNPNPKIRKEAVAVLNRPDSSDIEKEEAVSKLAYSYGSRLSYGAMRLLIMKGMKVLRGEASDLIPVVEGVARGQIREALGFGDQLADMAEEWFATEELLKEHPTMGGKLRKVIGLEGDRHGFPSNFELIGGEGKQILLWPVRDPTHLTDTIWELLSLSTHQGPQDFRLTIGVSGEVGDDLKPTALAIHALLPNPYAFAPDLGSSVFGWFAPVVEGGVGGPMGHVKMDGGGAEEDSDKPRRYDHLFMRFSYPPFASHLKPLVEEAPPEKKPWYRAAWDHLRGVRGVKKEKVGEWQKIFQGFIDRAQPEILSVDAAKRAIHIKLYLDEGKANQTEIVWLVSEKDWAEMVNEVGDADGKSSLLRIGIIFDEFQKRFFLEMMRWVGRKELKTVVDAVWVLGMLREIARNGDSATIPFAKSFTGAKRRALQRLEEEFRSQFSQLLGQKGLKTILETPWVGNKNWAKIYADMTAYQKAMGEDPEWKKSIVNLVEGVVGRAKEILQIP